MKVSVLAQLILNVTKTGIDLYKWQEKWLNDKSRFRIMLKSRAVGGSFIIALESITLSLLHRRTTILLLSYSLRQSMELFKKIKDQLSLLKNRKIKIYGEVYSLDPVYSESKTEVIFKNGSRIICLPNNPSTIRGYRADHVYVDEAAMFKDDSEIKAAVIPIIAGKRGRLSLISTPKGRRGWFYEAWISSQFSKHRVHYTEAQHITKEDLEELKKNVPPIIWMQEMEMEFIDESNNLFPIEKILSCIEDYPLTEIGGEPPKNPVYIGIDVGRYRDSTVVVVLEKMQDDSTKIISIEEMKGVDTSNQLEHISKMIEFFKPLGVAIDKTGLGIPFHDLLSQKYSNIEGLTITQPIKEMLIAKLYNYVSSRKIKLPIDCQELINQLRQFQVIYTKDGRARYESPPDGHDDYVIALALALYAASKPQTKPEILEIWR